MSEAASIIARLGLDSSGFRAGLDDAAKSADTAHGNMSNSVNRNYDAHERLLRSNHRVATQIKSFTQDLLNGGSAAQVFETGMIGLERSLNLPLGSLAGLIAGGLLIQQMIKGRDEAEEFNKEFEKVTGPHSAAAFRSVEDITAQLKTAREEKAKLEKENSSTTKQVLNLINPFLDPTGPQEYPSEQREKNNKRIEQLRGTESKLLEDLAKKERDLVDVEKLRVTIGERAADLKKIDNKYDEEIGKAASAGPDQNPAKVKALNALKAIEVDVVNRKFDELNAELELRQVRALAHNENVTAGQRKINDLRAELALRQQLAAEPGIPEEQRRARSVSASEASNNLLDARVDEFLKTPQQKAREFREAQRRDNARRTINAQDRDSAAGGRDPNGSGVHVGPVADLGGLVTTGLDPKLNDADWRGQFQSKNGSGQDPAKHLQDIVKNTADIAKKIGANR